MPAEFTKEQKQFFKHWLPEIIKTILENLQPRQIKKSKDFNVLVVDDEIGIREALSMILKDEYTVLTAGDAEEALRKIKEVEIDVAILDIMMPGMDGLMLLHSIKKQFPNIEVALITGYPSVESAVEAMRHGAYDYLTKPFDERQVREVVKQGVVRRIQKIVEKNMLSAVMEEGVEEKP